MPYDPDEPLNISIEAAQTLADAADPSDFDHVVFTDGWAVVGGSVPSVESFGLPEDLLPAVEQAVETGHKEL